MQVNPSETMERVLARANKIIEASVTPTFQIFFTWKPSVS